MFNFIHTYLRGKEVAMTPQPVLDALNALDSAAADKTAKTSAEATTSAAVVSAQAADTQANADLTTSTTAYVTAKQAAIEAIDSNYP